MEMIVWIKLSEILTPHELSHFRYCTLLHDVGLLEALHAGLPLLLLSLPELAAGSSPLLLALGCCSGCSGSHPLSQQSKFS